MIHLRGTEFSTSMMKPEQFWLNTNFCELKFLPLSNIEKCTNSLVIVYDIIFNMSPNLKLKPDVMWICNWSLMPSFLVL